MENEYFKEILYKLKKDPKFKKKMKTLAMVGVLGFLVTGGLVVWAGVSALSFVASQANHASQSSLVINQLDNLKKQTGFLSKFQAANCWSKVQSLLVVQPWVDRPLQENFSQLQVACLDVPKPALVKDLNQTEKGISI